MTLQIPRLDDRTYEQLVELLRRQLTSSDWTDHNASDPGIMLIELLAWLGEMALYRMDRVPRSHREKFLNFIIDPPEPVTVLAKFEAEFQRTGATTAVTVLPGTRVATNFVLGRRFVFETFEPLMLVRPEPAPPEPARIFTTASVKARAILEVLDEELGISDFSPHQVFELRPPRAALGITDADAPAPILTDFVHRNAGYEPNPLVSVTSGMTTEEWTAVPSLLSESERVATHPGARHFMVEANDSRIRFGDGVFGAIPAEGAIITCTRYQVLDGPPLRELPPPARHALTVKSGDVRHIVSVPDPVPPELPIPADVTLRVVGNTDAEGGGNFFPVSRRFARGLSQFRAPYRLVTERDFERALLDDYNAFQGLSQSAPDILRASVVFNKQPVAAGGLTVLVDAPAYVTVILLAGDATFDARFRDEDVSVADKQVMVTLSDDQWNRIKRFLDPRRLITTRLVNLAPLLRRVDIRATVVAAGDRNLADLQSALYRKVYDFLSPLHGDFDGRGWRLGRNVYRSQLFRLLESAEGVDHVETLVLSPVDAQGNVEIAPHELPVLQTLSLTTLRA
jgi:hypothetical protein